MLKILDSTLNYIGYIDNFISCIIYRKYRGIGTIEVSIAFDLVDFTLVQPFNFIWVADNKVFEILHLEVEQEQFTKIKIIGYDMAKSLAKRITEPLSNEEFDTYTGSEDEIVKYYIDNNLINPTNTDRTVAILDTATPRSGTNITDTTRYLNLYDEIVRVLTPNDIGFKFTLDRNTNKIIFDTYEGNDRTIDSATPVVFDTEFDNIINQNYVKSNQSDKNFIYVGGAGTGVNRTVATTGITTGMNRFEFFIDGGNITDTTQLENKGQAEITTIQNFDCKISQRTWFYETDYDLGDTVTIRSSFGIQVDKKITEIREIFDKGYKEIEVSFGDSITTIFTTIKNQNKQINRLSGR